MKPANTISTKTYKAMKRYKQTHGVDTALFYFYDIKGCEAYERFADGLFPEGAFENYVIIFWEIVNGRIRKGRIVKGGGAGSVIGWRTHSI